MYELTTAKQLLDCTVTQSWSNKKIIRKSFSGQSQEIVML